MSYFIGIRDFPFLHRQLSSPASKLIDITASSEDLAQDSKDVLVQRLHDLASQVTLQANLNNEDFTALHMDMDRMERILYRSPKIPLTHKFPDLQRATSETPRADTEDKLWSPFSPGRIVSRRFQDHSAKVALSQVQDLPEMSTEKAALLADEAEALLSSLSSAITELQARKEESDHIHDILIQRAEKAAQHVMDLEQRARDFDADFESNQSELSYLRLQLRALEVQGLQHIPFNSDEELTESIQKWKHDWADIDQRTRAKRKKVKAQVAVSDSSQMVS